MIFKGKTFNGIYLTAECEGQNTLIEDKKGLRREVDFKIFRINGEAGSKHPIGVTTLAPMPGCCGIVISCHTRLYEDARHTVLSDMFRELKQDLATALGYSAMIATTRMDNVPAVANMIKSKYKLHETFTNKRSNALLAFGFKRL